MGNTHKTRRRRCNIFSINTTSPCFYKKADMELCVESPHPLEQFRPRRLLDLASSGFPLSNAGPAVLRGTRYWKEPGSSSQVSVKYMALHCAILICNYNFHSDTWKVSMSKQYCAIRVLVELAMAELDGVICSEARNAWCHWDLQSLM